MFMFVPIYTILVVISALVSSTLVSWHSLDSSTTLVPRFHGFSWFTWCAWSYCSWSSWVVFLWCSSSWRSWPSSLSSVANRCAYWCPGSSWWLPSMAVRNVRSWCSWYSCTEAKEVPVQAARGLRRPSAATWSTWSLGSPGTPGTPGASRCFLVACDDGGIEVAEAGSPLSRSLVQSRCPHLRRHLVTWIPGTCTPGYLDNSLPGSLATWVVNEKSEGWRGPGWCMVVWLQLFGPDGPGLHMCPGDFTPSPSLDMGYLMLQEVHACLPAICMQLHSLYFPFPPISQFALLLRSLFTW